MPYNNSAHSATISARYLTLTTDIALVAHTHNARISRASELRSGFQSMRHTK